MEETHESKSVCIRVLCDVFRKVPARHPIRNKLKRFNGYTQKGDDVWMRQVPGGDGYLMEDLCDL